MNIELSDSDRKYLIKLIKSEIDKDGFIKTVTIRDLDSIYGLIDKLKGYKPS